MAEIVGYVNERVISSLGLSIAPGTPILLGESNIEHMKTSHPDAFEKYFDSLKLILEEPDFINRNPKDGSVKYIKQLDDNVIVGIRMSQAGSVFARTIYTFQLKKFEQYLSNGYLIDMRGK